RAPRKTLTWLTESRPSRPCQWYLISHVTAGPSLRTGLLLRTPTPGSSSAKADHAHRALSTSAMGDSSSPASYIRKLLIEKCLLFHMNKDECVEALSKHAAINPVITSTVWTELEKENKEFFEAYSKNREESVMEMMREMFTEMASRDPEDDEG
ncbi:hypothetical protein BHM03_00060613, partial [Ensete ventricosum]